MSHATTTSLAMSGLYIFCFNSTGSSAISTPSYINQYK
jgi:hypothetical protein